MLICFAWNRFLITSRALPSIWYCSEKSILAKQINDGTYLSVIWTFSFDSVSINEPTMTVNIIGQCDNKNITTLPTKTIMLVLNVLIYIITSITAHPIRLTVILAILSVSTFITAIILYTMYDSKKLIWLCTFLKKKIILWILSYVFSHLYPYFWIQKLYPLLQNINFVLSLSNTQWVYLWFNWNVTFTWQCLPFSISGLLSSWEIDFGFRVLIYFSIYHIFNIELKRTKLTSHTDTKLMGMSCYGKSHALIYL